VGKQFGNYQVTGKIGEGGMGAVYEAEHPDIGRKVAIKVLREHLVGSTEAVERFFRECRAVNEVHHPSLIEIFDLGRNDDGTVYAVMELLEGESLADRLRRGPLSHTDAVAIFADCAAGLGVVHGKGIVHRDLKPDNIFLIEGEDGPKVKILDFGLARVLGADTTLSAEGSILGTPLYMAPEQIEAAAVDPRTDVYAMGGVLFHMLTGRPPFSGDTVRELLTQHLTAKPPSAREIRSYVPEAIDRAIAKALAKDATDRFQSMRAFAAEVAQVDDLGEQVSSTLAAVAPVDLDVFARTAASNELSDTKADTQTSTSKARWPLFAGAVVLIGAGVAAVALMGGEKVPAPPEGNPTVSDVTGAVTAPSAANLKGVSLWTTGLPSDAMAYLPTECRAQRSAESCNYAGQAYFYGNRAAPSVRDAFEMFALGCDYEAQAAPHPRPCKNALALLLSDGGFGLGLYETDESRAAARSQRFKVSKEMEDRGFVASIRHEGGYDIDGSFVTYKKYCFNVRNESRSRIEKCFSELGRVCTEDSDPLACARLARMHGRPEYGPVDVQLATRYHEVACKAGVSASCLPRKRSQVD
jgi:serine/threonine-protein kinase